MIRENKNEIHRITATSTAPVTAKDQDLYRNEITGLYHVNIITEKIYEKNNIGSRKIKAACDGLNAIKKSMDANTTYLCQSKYLNLISDIYNKLMKYPITLSWQNMKGYQDEQGKPLDG